MLEYWKFGRWSLAASALAWFCGEIWSVLLPWLHGWASLSPVSAAGNLFKPLNPFSQSLASLMLPALARRRGDHAARRRIEWVFLAVCVLPVLLYSISVALFSEPLFRFAFAGRYAPRELVAPLGVAYTASAVNLVWSARFKSAADSRAVFDFWRLPALAVLIVGVPATWKWGAAGALWTMAGSYWLAVCTARLRIASSR